MSEIPTQSAPGVTDDSLQVAIDQMDRVNQRIARFQPMLGLLPSRTPDEVAEIEATIKRWNLYHSTNIDLIRSTLAGLSIQGTPAAELVDEAGSLSPPIGFYP